MLKCAKPTCPNWAAPGMKYCSKECAPLAGLSDRAPKSKAAKAGLTVDEIKQFQKRAMYVARKRGRPELAEDFAQEIFVAFARGRRATIEQLFVDFLRQHQGDSRTPGGRAMQVARARAVSLDEPCEDGGQVLRHELVGRPERGPDDLLDHLGCSGLFEGEDVQLYRLHFIEQRQNTDIADLYGVSESRISQRVNRMRERIRQELQFRQVWERFKDDSSFGQLEVQWLTM